MNKPSTIGVEFATKNVELKNNQGIVKAQIWDTGKEILNSNMILLQPVRNAIKLLHARNDNQTSLMYSLNFSHYRRASGALVVYDVTKEDTF